MKLIAILISIAVVVLVVVGYDLLMKAAQKRNESLPKEMQDAFDKYHEQQNEMEDLKSKLVKEEKTKSKTKSK